MAEKDNLVGLVVLKQPRVGSTWIKKELNDLPGTHWEFEPLTDGSHRCPARFTNAVLQRLVQEPLRCVNRKSRQKACYWTKVNCSTEKFFHMGGVANKSAYHISGFLIHHVYVPSISWPQLLSMPRVKLVVLRRSNLVKRTVSNMLRVAAEPIQPVIAKLPNSSARQMARPLGNRSGAHGQVLLMPAELLRQTRQSMISFARMPPGVSLSSADTFLVLYEDLQTSRSRLLQALLVWMGKPALARHISPGVAMTHWTKAPEALCSSLPNCDELRRTFEAAQAQCFVKQLLSSSPTPWTLPTNAAHHKRSTLAVAAHPGQSRPGQPRPGQPRPGQPRPGQPDLGQPDPDQPYLALLDVQARCRTLPAFSASSCHRRRAP